MKNQGAEHHERHRRRADHGWIAKAVELCGQTRKIRVTASLNGGEICRPPPGADAIAGVVDGVSPRQDGALRVREFERLIERQSERH